MNRETLLAGIADDARRAPLDVISQRLSDLDTQLDHLDRATSNELDDQMRALFVAAGRALIALASLGGVGWMKANELLRWRHMFEKALDHAGPFVPPDMHDIVVRAMLARRATLPS